MSFSSLPGNDPAVRMPARLAEPAGNPRVRCIGRLRDLQRYAAPLEALRLRSSDPGSVISLPEWLAARHVPEGWAARAILLHEDKQLEAALFLLEKTVAGISTGYFRGGDALGETLLLCEAGREEEYRTLILNLLLKRRRAFLVILDEPNESPTVAVAPDSPLSVRTVTEKLHWQHALEPTFEATLAPFGHRTRRNLRYALRRVVKNGWTFLPSLSARELISAIAHLSTHSTHPFPPEITAMRLRLAAGTSGSFAMGLMDEKGRWLSCLIGRRTEGVTDIFWQSNAHGFGIDSLCTTMRSLLMQEEVRRNFESGNTESGASKLLRYIGGTCELMQHCCTPTTARQTSITRPGLRHAMAKLLVKTTLLSANHPLRKHL